MGEELLCRVRARARVRREEVGRCLPRSREGALLRLFSLFPSGGRWLKPRWSCVVRECLLIKVSQTRDGFSSHSRALGRGV